MEYTTGYKYPTYVVAKNTGGTYSFDNPNNARYDTDELYSGFWANEPMSIIRKVLFEKSTSTTDTIHDNLTTPQLPDYTEGQGGAPADFIFNYVNSDFITPTVANASDFGVLVMLGEVGNIQISNALDCSGYEFSIPSLATIISADVKIRGYRTGGFFQFIDSIGIDLTYSMPEEGGSYAIIWD